MIDKGKNKNTLTQELKKTTTSKTTKPRNPTQNNLNKNIKLKAIKSSVAIELDYKKRLIAFTKQINKSLNRWVIARLAKGEGTPAKQLTFELNALNDEWLKKASAWGKGVANRLNKEISSYVDLNIQNQLKESVLKNLSPLYTIKSEKVTNALASAYERNLYLIKSIPSKIIDDYRQGFLNAISNFDREALKKMALNYQGISVRRAKFIARDQTAKGIQSYNQARAESLGFEFYQWITSKDERVSTGKGGHIHLDGRIYKYNEPTAIIDSYNTRGHTGQRPNCRCEAIAVLPNPNQEFKRVRDGNAGDYYILVEKK